MIFISTSQIQLDEDHRPLSWNFLCRDSMSGLLKGTFMSTIHCIFCHYGGNWSGTQLQMKEELPKLSVVWNVQYQPRGESDTIIKVVRHPDFWCVFTAIPKWPLKFDHITTDMLWKYVHASVTQVILLLFEGTLKEINVKFRVFNSSDNRHF